MQPLSRLIRITLSAVPTPRLRPQPCGAKLMRIQIKRASTRSALAGAPAVAAALAGAASAGFAKACEMPLMVAEIPLGSPASSASRDRASKRSLFEPGRMRGASGEARSGVSPDGAARVSDASQHLEGQSVAGWRDHRRPTGAEACPQPRNERVRRDCARGLDDACPCAADIPWRPPTIESFAQFRSLKSLGLQASLVRGCVNRGRFTSPASQRMLTARRPARDASSWMCQAGRLASQHPKGGTP